MSCGHRTIPTPTAPSRSPCERSTRLSVPCRPMTSARSPHSTVLDCTGSSMSPDRDRPAAPGAVVGFDHVALPMEHTAAMSSFYRDLGMEVIENQYLVQVYLGKQMINFHRPEM